MLEQREDVKSVCLLDVSKSGYLKSDSDYFEKFSFAEIVVGVKNKKVLSP
jgi:hypothetical protein